MRRDWTLIGLGLAAFTVAASLVGLASTLRIICPPPPRGDVGIDGYGPCHSGWHGWQGDTMTLAPLLIALVLVLIGAAALAYGLRAPGAGARRRS